MAEKTTTEKTDKTTSETTTSEKTGTTPGETLGIGTPNTQSTVESPAGQPGTVRMTNPDYVGNVGDKEMHTPEDARKGNIE